MKKKENYRSYSTEELVRLYEQAASAHGHANARGNYRSGNPEADKIVEIYREIKSRGAEHQKMLLPLLLSDNIGVCGWAGGHALEFAPRQGEAILVEIAKGQGIVSFVARMTLEVWRKGELRFP
jgi:hypothetical protein